MHIVQQSHGLKYTCAIYLPLENNSGFWCVLQSVGKRPPYTRGKYTAKNQYRKFEANIPRKGIARPQAQFPHHVSVSNLYIHTIDLPILLQEICGPILEICKSLTDKWVEIGTEAEQFSEKEYINGIIVAVSISKEAHDSCRFCCWNICGQHFSTKVHKLMDAALLLPKKDVEDAERKVIILPILVGWGGDRKGCNLFSFYSPDNPIFHSLVHFLFSLSPCSLYYLRLPLSPSTSPAPHCNEARIYVFLFWELRASAPISTFMCLWAIYTFPGSAHIFPAAE